jgi:hypothetical protein
MLLCRKFHFQFVESVLEVVKSIIPDLCMVVTEVTSFSFILSIASQSGVVVLGLKSDL